MYKTMQAYTKAVLDNPDKDLGAILSAVFATLSSEKLKEVEEYFVTFYKIGEMLRREKTVTINEIREDVGLKPLPIPEGENDDDDREARLPD